VSAPPSRVACPGAKVPKLPATAAGGVVLPQGCEFLSVAAASATDIWAVGARIGPADGRRSPVASDSLVEHWDGHHWTLVSTPAVGGLDAVAAISPRDIWAASSGDVAAGFGRGAFLHWNGSVWRRVRAATTPATAFSALVAAGSRDVWAIGSTGDGRAVVEHWGGHGWRAVRIAPLSRLIARRDVELTGVIARRAGDVWIAGTISPHPRPGRHDFTRALVLHWDGHTWRRIPGPHPGRSIDTIAAMGLDAGGHVWLGGTFETTRPDGHIVAFGALLAVRTNRGWVTSRLPGSYRQAYTPVSIAGAATDDVWAVGSGEWASGRFAAHWNGSRWTQVLFQSRHEAITPYAVTTSARNTWLVGAENTRPARLLPIALHWNGHAWVDTRAVG
jgi:hypothetical protein